MTTENACGPNFLYIGAEKAGSSWIYEALREHPEVFVPLAKDIQFFDKNYEKGWQWYQSFFTPADNKKAIGEICHDYFLKEETARKIQKHLPHTRLVCCLREPVEKTFSTFLYRKNIVLDKNISFADVAFDAEVLNLSDYYHNLRPFYELFPRENILVLFYDDLKEDPSQFVRKLYQFLGVDPAFQPSVLYKKVLPASKPRLVWLAHLSYKIGALLRRLGMANIVGAVKRNSIFRAMFYSELEEKPAMPEDVAQELKQYYVKRFQQLPQLIGRTLPDEWGYELK